MEDQKSDHQSRTRYLKPVDNVSFTSQEMMSGIFASINPTLVASVNQLHGDRKGVVRVTCKTLDSASEFESKVMSRRVHINNVRLAPVTESGHFIKVTLLDVPEYLSSNDIEKSLREYGSVVHIKREYMDYHGIKIENETRHVLFSKLSRELPVKIALDGQEVHVNCQRHPAGGAAKHRHGSHHVEADVLISQPDNIPKHVMNAIINSSEGYRKAYQNSEKNSDSAKLSPGDSSLTNSGDASREARPREKERVPHVEIPLPKRSLSAAPSPNVSRHSFAPAYAGGHDGKDDVRGHRGEDRGTTHTRPNTIYVGGSRAAARRRSLDQGGERDYYEQATAAYSRVKTPDSETNI